MAKHVVMILNQLRKSTRFSIFCNAKKLQSNETFLVFTPTPTLNGSFREIKHWQLLGLKISNHGFKLT